jgi:hypothetical protein
MNVPLKSVLLVLGALSLGGVVALKTAHAETLTLDPSCGGNDSGSSIGLTEKKDGGWVELADKKEGGVIELAEKKEGGWVTLAEKKGTGVVVELAEKKEGGVIELAEKKDGGSADPLLATR